MKIPNMGRPFIRRYISADIQDFQWENPLNVEKHFARSHTSGHKRELTQVRKYECKECGDAFCQKSHFSRH